MKETLLVGESSDSKHGVYSLEEAQTLIEGNQDYSVKIVSWTVAVEIASSPEKYSVDLLFAASDTLDRLKKYYLTHDDTEGYIKVDKLQDNILAVLK